MREKITKKEFREDLYFRLSGFQFHLKSLSERVDDIDLMIKLFQKKSSRRYVIKAEAIELLKKHSWPGNVRELFKVCEQFSQSLTGIVEADLVRRTISQDSRSHGQGTIEGWEEYVQTHGLRSFIASIEKRSVEESMKRNKGKITACIRELKISSSAFYRILQEHQLHF
jgi:DNA-binding NtrC family response regulator